MSRHSLRLLTKVLAASLVLVGPIGFAQAATNWSASYGGCASGYTYSLASSNSFGSVGCAAETGSIDTNVAALSWKYSGSLPTSPTTITGATSTYNSSVVSWGSNGLGVYALGDTNETHTVDNSGYYIDSIVLQFDQSVTMNELSIGWKYGDADISVFAWTGADPGSSATPSSLKGGWTSVAQLSNVNVNTQTSFTNTSYSSSYWLVAALGNDSNVDSFKLLSVAGLYGTTTPPTGVPEPGSLALLGLGAAGLLAARRKSVARR